MREREREGKGEEGEGEAEEEVRASGGIRNFRIACAKLSRNDQSGNTSGDGMVIKEKYQVTRDSSTASPFNLIFSPFLLLLLYRDSSKFMDHR